MYKFIILALFVLLSCDEDTTEFPLLGEWNVNQTLVGINNEGVDSSSFNIEFLNNGKGFFNINRISEHQFEYTFDADKSEFAILNLHPSLDTLSDINSILSFQILSFNSESANCSIFNSLKTIGYWKMRK